MCVYACAYARERAGRADKKVLGALGSLEALESLGNLGSLENLENSQRVKSEAIEEMQNAECRMQNAELTNFSQKWKSEAIRLFLC